MDNKEIMVFDYWQNLKAKEFSLIDKDITCINLKNSELESFNIAYCKAVGANFKKSLLKKCRFKNCDLGECDFTDSTLENIIFEDCELRKVNFKNTKFINAYLINKEKIKKIIAK